MENLVDWSFRRPPITDQNLDDQLRLLPDGTASVNLEGNRLSKVGLKELIAFMKSRDTLDVCVANNSFYFMEFYIVMEGDGVLDWIFSDRLRFGRNPSECELAKIATKALQNGSSVAEMQRTLFQAHLDLTKALQSSDERLTAANAKVSKVLEALNNYNQSRNKEIEDQVVDGLVTFLKSNRFSKVERVRMSKKLQAIVDGPILAEWDGYIQAVNDSGTRFLFLVEAKSMVRKEHITKLQGKLEVTRSFIKYATKDGTSSQVQFFAFQQAILVPVLASNTAFSETLRLQATDAGHHVCFVSQLDYDVSLPTDSSLLFQATADAEPSSVE